MLSLLLACAPEYALHETAPCLDFEEDLSDLGLGADLVRMEDGAIVRRVTEGHDFSALLGEEELDLPGQHSVLLRSSHLGRVGTTARIELLAPAGATGLRMLQLSEVEDSIELLLVQDGWTELPVHTGGFVPALKPEHAPIHEHVEITHEAPLMGDFVEVYAPVEPGWLELTQTTLSEGNGFFTLIDKVCWVF